MTKNLNAAFGICGLILLLSFWANTQAELPFSISGTTPPTSTAGFVTQTVTNGLVGTNQLAVTVAGATNGLTPQNAFIVTTTNSNVFATNLLQTIDRLLVTSNAVVQGGVIITNSGAVKPLTIYTTTDTTGTQSPTFAIKAIGVDIHPSFSVQSTDGGGTLYTDNWITSSVGKWVMGYGLQILDSSNIRNGALVANLVPGTVEFGPKVVCDLTLFAKGYGVVLGQNDSTNSLHQGVHVIYPGAVTNITWPIAFTSLPFVNFGVTTSSGTAILNDTPWATNVTVTGCTVGFRTGAGGVSAAAMTVDVTALGTY